ILVPQLRRPLRREGLVPGEDLHRVAWHQVQHQETEHRDTDQDGDRLEQALRDVGDHSRESWVVSRESRCLRSAELNSRLTTRCLYSKLITRNHDSRLTTHDSRLTTTFSPAHHKSTRTRRARRALRPGPPLAWRHL